MKLLGRLHRGPKRADKSDDRNNTTSSNHAPIHASSPFRRKKRDSRPRVPAPPLMQSRYENNSGNSIISIPTNGYDDNTIDANTLYEWSLADNTPSIGSAAELFLDKKVNKDKGGGGYGSSSDEDDEEDDAQDENSQHIKYCKLSDSPPPKSSNADDEQTPVRKGRGLFNRSNNSMNARTKVPFKIPAYSPDRLKSPSRIKTKNQRGTHSPKGLPIQSLRRSKTSSTSGPVDVDSFLDEAGSGVTNHGQRKAATYQLRRNSRTSDSNSSNSSTNVSSNEKQLPAELKGRIHAVNFDDEDNDNLNSSCESNQTGDNSSSLDNASVKNVGNANSPKKSTRMVDPSTFSSSRNIGDMNSPMRMIQKELAEMEPEFTFSISEEDLFGSDVDSIGATAWLLNEGSECTANELGSDNLLEKRRWELDKLQADIKRDERSVAALAGDDVVGGSSVNTKKFRKKVKDQMKNKFQSIVNKKKNKANGLTENTKKENGRADHKINKNPVNSNRVDRAKLTRDQSGLSVMPLTGLEDHSRIRMGKYRKNKELAQEVERRKERERQDIEKRHQENQHRSMLEKNRRQRQREAMKWKSGGANDSNYCSNDAVAKPESLERLENRKKLEKWMMGVTDNDESRHEAHEQQHQYLEQEGQLQKESPRRYLPSAYDGNPPITSRSQCTISTNRVENTTTRRQSLHKGTFDFDAQFPDEDSTAQTPEASAPTTHDFACVLCKTAERTHLAVPCMHFSFCGGCVAKMEQKGSANGGMCCSVCNEKATKFSKVFY